MKTPKNIKTQKIKNSKKQKDGRRENRLFFCFWKVKILDEELLKCYNTKYNQRTKYLQNKQKEK